MKKILSYGTDTQGYIVTHILLMILAIALTAFYYPNLSESFTLPFIFKSNTLEASKIFALTFLGLNILSGLVNTYILVKKIHYKSPILLMSIPAMIGAFLVASYYALLKVGAGGVSIFMSWKAFATLLILGVPCFILKDYWRVKNGKFK